MAQGDELVSTISALGRLGEQMRWLPARVYGAQWEATIAMLEGRWDDVRARRRSAAPAQAYSGAAGMEQVQGFLVARELGEHSIASGVRVKTFPAVHLRLRVDPARRRRRRKHRGGRGPATHHSRSQRIHAAGVGAARGAALGVLAEVAATVGAQEHAAPLYDSLAPHTGHLLSVLLGLS